MPVHVGSGLPNVAKALQLQKVGDVVCRGIFKYHIAHDSVSVAGVNARQWWQLKLTASSCAARMIVVVFQG